MKYQKVKTLIIGFVFSAAAMTACGAYGSMSPDPNSFDPTENEDVAVYGGPVEDTVWDAEEMGPDSPSGNKDGFDESTNQSIEIGNLSLSLPSYMEEKETSTVYDPALTETSDSVKIYPLEENEDGSFACLVISEGSLTNLLTPHEEDLLGGNTLEDVGLGDTIFTANLGTQVQVMTLEQQGYIMENSLDKFLYPDMGEVTVFQTSYFKGTFADEVSDTETEAAESEVTETAAAGDDSSTAANELFPGNDSFCIFSTFFIDPDNLDHYVCVSLYQSLDPASEYNYNDDYASIISSAVYTDNNK